MKNILVTTDGSKNSNKALIEAKRLAEAMGGKVTLLHVVHDIVAHPYLVRQEYSIKTNESLMKLGEELLKESLSFFEGFSGEIDTKLRTGDAGKEIIEEAESGDYDLVVMGSRGLGTFSRAMLGSVSNKVLNHVDINVFVVK